MYKLKHFALLTLVLFACTQGHVRAFQTPNPIVGNWEGVLSIGNVKLRLIVKVTESPATGLKAVMDSVDQPGGNNLVVDTITFQDSKLHFEMKQLSVVYDGTLSKNGSEITGTFVQGNSYPMIFRKEGAVQSTAQVKREPLSFHHATIRTSPVILSAANMKCLKIATQSQAERSH